MKRKIIIHLILLSNIVYSQQAFNYAGVLIIEENDTPISFTLNLTEEKGVVNGFSITNIGTEDETKTEITGLYFKSDKSFQIQEKKIIYTKSEAPLHQFCYINMNLNIKGTFGNKQLEGNFTGYLQNNNECAKGKILLIEEKKIKKAINKISVEYEEKDNESISYQTKRLENKDTLSINWQSESIIIYIWDADQEDGDKIKLDLNNQTILNNFETKKRRKKVIHKLSKGENILKITATNVGDAPPNTSKVELYDGQQIHPLIIQLEKDNAVIIKIKR